MSIKPIPGVFELLKFKPDTSNPEKTKKLLKEEAAVATSHSGGRGIPFEGIAREEPDVSIRCIHWDSVEAHTKDFLSSPEFKEHLKKGKIYEVVSSPHYHLYDELALSEKPKVIEYVWYHLNNADDFPAFYVEWHEGLKGVESTPGAFPTALGQQVEDPTAVVQILPWATLEAHLTGFKKRADVGDVMKVLGVTVDKYVKGGWKGMKSYHLLLTEVGDAVSA